MLIFISFMIHLQNQIDFTEDFPHVDRFPSQNAGIVVLCHRSVFIFKEQVYPSAHFSMFCKNKLFQL